MRGRRWGSSVPAGALVTGADEGSHPFFGFAAALTCGIDGGPGLLVTGVCLNPDQVLELAGLVAVIAGRSRIKQHDCPQVEEP